MGLNESVRSLGTKLRRRVAPGQAPGTLEARPEAGPPLIRVFAYGPDDFEQCRVGSVDAIQPFLDKWPVTWINVDGLGSPEIMRQLGKLFGLHRLELEDVVNVGQRPRVEEYDDHLFFIMRMVARGERAGIEQLSVFLGEGFVLTFQEWKGDNFEPVRERIRHGRGQMRRSGPDYLMYALIDAAVDYYFPFLEQYDERLEAVEDEVMDPQKSSCVATLHAMRREIRSLRRAILPLRSAMEKLIREPTPIIKKTTLPYFRDCHDHVVRAGEQVETFGEHAGELMDLDLSLASNRMNEIMKVLTVVAVIFIPLTFLAGIYGMNFEFMPELGWRWAYPALLVVFGGVAISMVLYFRRKDWF